MALALTASQYENMLSFSACMLSHFSCVQPFVTWWTVVHQAPLSMGFSRQEYWSGLPFLPPGHLPHPGMEPLPLISLALAGRFFTSSTTWEAEVTLVTREMQIKTTVKYQFTPIRMDTFKVNKKRMGMQRNWNTHALLVGKITVEKSKGVSSKN